MRRQEDTRAVPEDLPRLFTAQHARPAGLCDVRLWELSPALRVLLCHDGTLTTGLAACHLVPIEVQPLGETARQLGDDDAELLGAAPHTEALWRAVAIRSRTTGDLLAEAESVMLPSRLPAAFAETLAVAPKGLGEVFDTLGMAVRRELLWYGRARTHRGAFGQAGDVVRRYRLEYRERPVALIQELFSLRSERT